MEPNINQHIKLVVIGRTGAGKTTFINSIVNLFYGVKYPEKRHIAITQNFELRDKNGNPVKIRIECNMDEFKDKQSDNDKGQQFSQTHKCHIYTLESNGLKLSLIDSPGLGDTGGIKQDQQNVANIVNGVRQLSNFNAICLVHKGIDSRVDDMLLYLINELKGMLTKECQKNFIICFTGVVNPTKIDSLGAMQQMEIPTDNYLYFENDCLLPLNLIPNYDEDYEEMTTMYWNRNMKNFKKLLEIASNMIPQSSEPIMVLHHNKSMLHRLVHQESHKAQSINAKKANLDRRKMDIAEAQQEINLNQDHTKPIDQMESYLEDQPYSKWENTPIAPDKATVCRFCDSLCHNPCGLELISGKGNLEFKNCYAFGGSTVCNQCNCNINDHEHTQTIRKLITKIQQVPATRKVSINFTDTSKKTRFETGQQNLQIYQSQLATLNNEISSLESELQNSYKKMAFLFTQINSTSLKPINDRFLEYLDFLEKNLKENRSISNTKLNERLAEIEESRKQYNLIVDVTKKALQNNQNVLSQAEQLEIQKDLEKMKQGEAEVLQLYK